MHTYKRSDPGLFTAGHYDPDGEWQPESDHDDREEAAKRAAFLNGYSLPELDRPCEPCGGNGIVTTSAWLAWDEQARKLRSEWEAANPGASWFSSPLREAAEDGYPDEAEQECGDCGGVGDRPTEAGRALLEFLRRHGR